MKKIFYIFSLITFFASAQAQNVLTVDEAVAIALKNNYDVLLAQNNAEIAKANNTLGNAGMLPSLGAVGNASYALSNIENKALNGSTTNFPNQGATSYGAGVELSWSILDGGRMFVTKERLNEIQALGELQFQAQVLETAYEVIAVYYDIVRQKQQLKAIEEVITFNQERVKLAKAGVNAGSRIQSDLLQAKIDLNFAYENQIIQETSMKSAKRYLNQLLVRDANTPVEVTDEILFSYIVDKEKLIEKLNSSNKNILAFQKQIEIAQLVLRENKHAYFPSLDIRGGYYFSKTDYTDGSSPSSRIYNAQISNRVYGPQIGGTLKIPLYQAGEAKRRTRVAKLDMQSAEYNLDKTKLQMLVELENILEEFDAQSRLLEIEEENNRLTKQNLDISMLRLRLGQTTSLEVHQAQQNFVQSSARLVNFRYGLKIAESQLRLLVSEL